MTDNAPGTRVRITTATGYAGQEGIIVNTTSSGASISLDVKGGGTFPLHFGRAEFEVIK